MTTLHLGVVDVPYTRKGDTATTGQVAEWLEDEYHVMRVFVELHEQKIADLIALRLAAIVDVGLKNQASIVFNEVESLFKDYLMNSEWASIAPTSRQIVAAQSGKSKRFKSGKAKKARPAFIDTGLYMASFRAWIDTWAS